MKKSNNGSDTQNPPVVSTDAILAFLRSQNGRASKAEIARHFGVKGHDRIGLKQILRELLAKGTLHHGTFRSFMLPELTQKLKKESNDAEMNERLARRGRRNEEEENEEAEERPAPRRTMREMREDARDPTSFIGLYQPMVTGGGMVNPVSRQDKHPILIAEGYNNKARRGDLVQAKYSSGNWKVIEILAEPDDAGVVSLMAIKTLDIPHEFPQEVLDATKGMKVPALGKRTDLRDMPLVTIDGEDARDFDDAVHAEEDDSPTNKGGWKITVAIADVAHYVTPESALDIEAYKRGNSVYFPDRVVPMLPEALSNDLCSLRPHEPRACMAALMRVDKFGQLIDTKIVRGLMESKARLTYTEVQEAFDGQPNDKTAPILDSIIKPLYEAYRVLAQARADRGTVELDLPERKVQLKDGVIQDIVTRARFDSHKLIEEMMILANVAVAKAFEAKHQEALFRIHPKPDAARWSTTREFLHELGLKTKPGLHPKPSDLQQLLDAVEGRDEAPLVHDIVLRTMSQASYSPENVGHYGLALEHYAHFTSPIRRYADLIVHRALIRAYKLGDDGLTDHEMGRLEIIGNHISDRERVAQSAERETIDRYIALYMEDKVGATFPARIRGVTHFGLFVAVDPMGADGLIPVRTLPDDYYIHDEKRHSLVGRRTGLTFRLAMPVTVRLLEVESATGRLMMDLVPGTFAIPEPSRERRFMRDSGSRDRRDHDSDSRPRRGGGGYGRDSGRDSGRGGPPRGNSGGFRGKKGR